MFSLSLSLYFITSYFILILLLLPFRTLSEAEVPLAPASVDLLPLSPESIRVDFTPPSSDRGSEITSYLIEWDTDPGVREVQEVRTRSYVGANEVQEISTSIPAGSCCCTSRKAEDLKKITEKDNTQRSFTAGCRCVKRV